jgi:hypothetical protein
MRLSSVNSGHLRVRLKPSSSGRSKFPAVHRLVLEAFVGPCPEGKEARHFPDRDPRNNRLDNLSWATRTTNQRDRDFHGTSNSKPTKVKACENCGKRMVLRSFQNQKCCSVICSNRNIAGTRTGYHKAGVWTKHCKQCGKKMKFRYHCHAKTRKFCSMVCRDLMRKANKERVPCAL